MAKGDRAVLKYTVVEDSKDRMILETKGSRIASLGCFTIIGGFFLLAFILVKEGLIVDMLFAVGAASGFGIAVFAFFDKERWIFEETSKVLTYTSRLRPWKNLTIKANQVEGAEIERDVVEYTYRSHSRSGFSYPREKTYYKNVYTLYLTTKDGRRIKVSRDSDSGYQRKLSLRLTGRTAKTIDMVEIKKKAKQRKREKLEEKIGEEPVYKGQPLSHWMELLNSQDQSERIEAIIAVGMIGHEAWKAEPSLIEALKDQDEDIRWLAAQKLGSIDPGDEAAQALLDVLENRQEVTKVRAAAADTLGRIRADVRAAIPALSEALSSEDAFLRVTAAASLMKMDSSYSVKSLKVFSEGLKDNQSIVRNTAIRALGKMGEDAKEVVPELAKALKDEDKWCRLAAADALESLGANANEAVPALFEALKDDDDRLRKTARRALDKIQEE